MALGKSFSIQAIFKATDRLSAPIAKIKGQLVGLGRAGASAFRGMNGFADKTLKTVGSFSNAIGVAGVASLAGLGFELQNVMTKGAEFEKTLIRTGSAFETPIKRGSKGFAELSAAARHIGDTTEFSSQQAAEALNSLATAGYDSQQSIAALPKVVDFASAAQLDLGQASDIASDSLGAFNLRSNDAATNTRNMGRVMDSLTRAAADSTTNVAELFEGLRAGGAFASTAGATLEQFVALQGVLANKGFKGAEAGTAIRNSYLHLTKQTKEAAEAQRALGVTTAKNKDGSIDLMTTIGRFTKATKGLTREKKAEAIATIFGAYTVGPFLALMESGEKTVKRFTKNLQGATGVTEQMAGSMRESTSAQIAKFFNILDNVRLDVFEAIAPVVLDITKAVGKWVTANKDLIAQKAGEWATALKDNLPEIVMWVERLAIGLGAFVGLAAGIKTVNLAIDAYELATKAAALATGGLQLASSAMLTILNSNAIFTARLTLAQWASRAATMASTGATWLWNAALQAGRLATTRLTVSQVAGKVVQIAGNAVTWLATAAHTAYAAIVGASSAAVSGFSLASVGAKIAQIASNVVTWLATAAQTAYAAVLGVSSAAVTAYGIATGKTVPVIGAQNAAMAPLLITVGALLAAVGALYLAWDQYNKLDKDLAGAGGIAGTFSKMWEMGTIDPFAASDAIMNEKAKAEAEKRNKPQMVTPQARAAEATAEAVAGAPAKVNGTITVKAKPGTEATVENKPKRPPIKVEQSGAFGGGK